MTGNDGVVRYREGFYQVSRASRVPAQAKVLMCESRRGALTMEYYGRALRFAEIGAPGPPSEVQAS